MNNTPGSGPRAWALTALVLATAMIAPLALAPTPPAAAAAEPEVIQTDPYYLSMFEGRGEDRGTVLLLHGGGWRGGLGPRADVAMRDYIRMITGWGYDVANLGYRGGAQSIEDSLAAFDRLRGELGAGERLCLFGGSAGAHLALTIAAERGSEVDCVVDFLGPPDLVEWGEAPAADVGLRLAEQAFGEDRLAELSPINNVDRIESPVLVVASPCDAFIDLAGQRQYASALSEAGVDARLQVIATGDDVAIGHCAASEPSFNRFEDAARSLLAGRTPGAVEAPENDDSGIGPAVVLAGAVVVAGLALLFWSTRRRA